MSLLKNICITCHVIRTRCYSTLCRPSIRGDRLLGIALRTSIYQRKYAPTPKFEPGKPRTLLELYEDNPSWLSKQRAGKPSGAVDEGIKLATSPDVDDNKGELPKPSKPFPVIIAEKKEWGFRSRRTGAVGIKLGMSMLWLKSGRAVACTMVQIHECEVVKARVGHKDGGMDASTYMEVGAVNEKDLTKVKETWFAFYLSTGVDPKKFLKPFKVTPDALLPAGTQISAAHFRPGQLVKLVARSKTKGFQGVMKRWGMKGQPASHGASKTHRKMGATGGGGDPGRIWPGKKMPGHMGGVKIGYQKVKVLRINTKHNVLYLEGPVPGEVGDWVKLSDSERQKNKTGLPFPTYFADEEDPLPEDLYDERVQPYTEGTLSFNEEETARS